MRLVSDHNKTIFMRGNLLQMVSIHFVTLVVAPFLFSWNAFFFALALALLFGYSMSVFHHLLLTHRGFQCKKWVENLGVLLGALTWRGPFAGPVLYVALHRIHHAHADTDLDPHTPEKGIFFALLSWFWNMPLGFSQPEYYDTYAEDTAADTFHVFLDRHVHLLQLIWGALCFCGGTLLPLLAGGALDPMNGLRYLVFGVFVRALIGLYFGNLADVISHTSGYRSYETKGKSTNNFLVAVLQLGGAFAWHNNHHAHQHYFHVRKHWWELDAHFAFVRGLSRFGLAWDILVLDETRGRSRVIVGETITSARL